MLARLAGSKKTPAEIDGQPLISFEDNAENVLFVEKKLQTECFVGEITKKKYLFCVSAAPPPTVRAGLGTSPWQCCR